jgi:metal-dependent amidase/aminoacylase/carboxypeptidase family protein
MLTEMRRVALAFLSVTAFPTALAIAVSCGSAQAPTSPPTTSAPVAPLAWDAANALLYARVVANAAAEESALIEFRRDLHRHPELSRQEQRTSAVIADRLRGLGLDVRTNIGGYGVVGLLRGARPGPTIAYRADMDAFPSPDADPVSFASDTPGVRHICGHDLHVTVGLGLAAALAPLRSELAGTFMFIFQPAEETATGAKAMLAAGLFSVEKPSAIFGIHTSAGEVGRIASRAGRMMNANAVAPGVVNDDALYERARTSIATALGAGAIVNSGEPPGQFSENFGEFQAQVPGVFFFLGASNSAAGVVSYPHTAAFVIDERAILVGIRAMAAVVLGV